MNYVSISEDRNRNSKDPWLYCQTHPQATVQAVYNKAMEEVFLKGIRKRLILLKGNRSIKEFARTLDLPVSTVYYYFNGRQPTLSFLLRVARRLNVNEEWLFTGRGNIFKDKDDEAFRIEDVIEFLKKGWDSWSHGKRQWFERHFKEIFPKFELWLKEIRLEHY